jgi:hypothetical protein
MALCKAKIELMMSIVQYYFGLNGRGGVTKNKSHTSPQPRPKMSRRQLSFCALS